MQYLFEEIVKSRGLSFVLDSNLAKFQTAQENVKKLLEKGYKIEIYYENIGYEEFYKIVPEFESEKNND